MQSDSTKAKLAMVTAGRLRDVMMSYDHEDRDIVKKIKRLLTNAGIHAWMEDDDIQSGTDVLARLGQAVLDCHAFMFVMSSTSVQSKICQDQLALAYVSNKLIVPVALAEPPSLLNLMENGMRLQLAGFEWFSVDPDTVDDNCKDLANTLKQRLGIIKEDMAKGETTKPSDSRKRKLNRTLSTKISANEAKLYIEDGNQYWIKAFSTDKVPWQTFKDKVYYDFKDDIDNMTGKEDTDWLFAILHRELEVGEDEIVTKDNFIVFCTLDDMILPLWVRIQDQARESYAMREVFEIDSSVRVHAIENLGKFRSSTVIDALRDLLSDKDVNVQAVAIISLARTGATDIKSRVAIRKCLQTKDRVVREAACLALGKLKAEEAIDTLVNLWRNDIISNVREAALVALKNIGGTKAEEAIRITTVLEGEIRRLSSTTT